MPIKQSPETPADYRTFRGALSEFDDWDSLAYVAEHNPDNVRFGKDWWDTLAAKPAPCRSVFAQEG